MTVMMKLFQQRQRPVCPRCNTATQIRKHGKARSGLQRYMCLDCRGTFQARYIYATYQTDGNARVGG